MPQSCSLVLGNGPVNLPAFALAFLPPILLVAARTFFNIFDHSHLSSYPLKSTNSFPRLDYKDRGPKQGHPSVHGFPLSCLPNPSLFMPDIPSHESPYFIHTGSFFFPLSPMLSPTTGDLTCGSLFLANVFFRSSAD